MNFFKRAAWGIWRHKFKNILLIAIFAVIFAVTLISFMVYTATSHQVEVTQKAVGNAVTLQGPLINGMLSSNTSDFRWSDADSFVKSDLVDRYNIVITGVDMNVLGSLPYLRSEEDRELYREFQAVISHTEDIPGMWEWCYETQDKGGYYAIREDEENPGYRWDMTWDEERKTFFVEGYNPNYSQEENDRYLKLYQASIGIVESGIVPLGFQITAISDSEYFDPFSSGGYTLVDGRHFKSEEEDQNYVLISQEVAEANGLHVGDTLSLQFGVQSQMIAMFPNPHVWELEILGIFEPPDAAFNEQGYTAANFVYVPFQAMFDYLWDQYNNDALLWFPHVNRATAYLKSPEDVDAFVKEAYEKFDVIEMTDWNSPPKGTSIEDLLGEDAFGSGDPDVIDTKFNDFISGAMDTHPWFSLMVDRGWYEMVAAPLENVNSLTLVMGIGLLVGAFVVVLLICVFNVRKRKKEVGILLSMGEPKIKVFLQMLLEQAVPLVFAALIGFAAGVPFATAFGNQLLSGKASQVNEAYQQDKRQFLEEQLEGNMLSIEDTQTIRSSANVVAATKLQFQLDSRLTVLYFAGMFSLLFLTVLIQMIFLLRLSPARILARKN